MTRKIIVYCSGAAIDAFRRMVPYLSKLLDVELDVRQGSSIGTGKKAIPPLLRIYEPCDVAVLFDDVVDGLAQEGVLRSGSKRRVASSSIGMAVREGQTVPDISSVAALRTVLAGAVSVAYSASGSGIYLEEELFPKLGIAEQIRTRCRRIVGERVGAVVARGEVEIGFQQMSELVAMPGITIAGLLPAEVQHITVISAAIPVAAANPILAGQLIAALSSGFAREQLKQAGLDELSIDA